MAASGRRPNVCCVFWIALASSPAICWQRLMAARRHDGGSSGAAAGAEPDPGRSREPVVGPRQAACPFSQHRASFVGAPPLRTVPGNCPRRVPASPLRRPSAYPVPARSLAIRCLQDSRYPQLWAGCREVMEPGSCGSGIGAAPHRKYPYAAPLGQQGHGGSPDSAERLRQEFKHCEVETF